jgi:microcystin-dependent protein
MSEPFVGQIMLWPVKFIPVDWALCNGQILQVRQYQALFSLIGNTYGGDGTTTFALPNLMGRFPLGSPSVTNVGPTAGTPITIPGGSSTATVTGSATGNISIGLNNLPAHNHTATFTPTTGNQPVTIPATTGNLQVAASLPLGTTQTGSATPGAGANYLNAVKGTVPAGLGTNSVTFTGPYSSANPGTASNLPAAVTVTGNAGTASSTVTIQTVTGGAVAVANTGVGAALNVSLPLSATVNTTAPYITLNYIIALLGIYPTRSD